ncbi:evolutionarily conserved C-terminal region 11 [Striga asiatica]|uniref:YTH domain-containing family protein n=1 Tax=Striga asiatica TaxID=4170 RepID=A0A5A7Q0Z3_STRAF|nr:evolutionarily conserved C-terminal region 11 [Striga asiatica]
MQACTSQTAEDETTNTNKSRETFRRNSGFEALMELTCGLRSEARNNSSENEYDLQEFQTEYVIKPYSKDDVHKYIKYDVWSSTPNGNKKLDAAFRDSDAKRNWSEVSCLSIFLAVNAYYFNVLQSMKCKFNVRYLQVNGSGQFVGVAEMIGKVDFSKNMDFWQLDKSNLVLVVRGLDENVDEEMLRYEFSNRAPIKDLRLVRDKFTHLKRLCIRAFLFSKFNIASLFILDDIEESVFLSNLQNVLEVSAELDAETKCLSKLCKQDAAA